MHRLLRSRVSHYKKIADLQFTEVQSNICNARLVQNTTESLVHLKIAREKAQEKTWNASRITGRKEENIFRECNVLLYRALLMYAQQVADQPDVALEACTEALARAADCTAFSFY